MNKIETSEMARQPRRERHGSIIRRNLWKGGSLKILLFDKFLIYHDYFIRLCYVAKPSFSK